MEGGMPKIISPQEETPESKILTLTSILNSVDISFEWDESSGGGGGANLLSSSDGGGDDGGGGAVTYTPVSLSITNIFPETHGLTIEGTRAYGDYEATIMAAASITWLDKEYNPTTTDDWNKVPPKTDPNFYCIVEFKDSPTRNVTMRFVVTGVLESSLGETIEITETFTQVVVNDWTRGGEKLQSYMSGEINNP